MQAFIDRLLAAHAIEPVLVDVGASGGTPRIWQAIRRHSSYVGFDGDSREIREIKAGEFKSSKIINEVVTADADAREAHFFLTRSPYCSSTLHPNPRVTDNFLSADSFIIERESSARASTLNSVIERLGIDRIDWLKLDTQGCDLRIFESLRPGLREKLLAVDLEPGLRGAYVGEDLFSDVHKKLTAEGYWLSDLKVCGLVRMRKATLNELASTRPDLDAQTLARCVRPTPGWTECRYLRSLESLAEAAAGVREYVLLFVAALMDRQHGFCLDLSVEYERRFGADETCRSLRAQALGCIDESKATLDAKEAERVRAMRLGPIGRVKRKVRTVLSLAYPRML
jgi:FkbM family methyltransferase